MSNKKRLEFLINRSNKLYCIYKNNPIYLNALLIKNTNEKIIDLLLNDGFTFNNENNVNKILNHFLVWYNQFIYYEKNNFNLFDEFIFGSTEYSIPYPSDEIQTILK